jgi:hypothetical protein
MSKPVVEVQVRAVAAMSEGKLAQVAALKVTLAKIEQRIKRSYGILTSPKYGDQSSRAFDVSHHSSHQGG